MANGDDWEERLMEQLLQMLATFGIEFDRDDLDRMMDLFRNHLDKMGLDLEKANGDVRFNLDMEELGRLFQNGGGLEDLMRGLGLDVTVDAKQVEVDDEAHNLNPDIDHTSCPSFAPAPVPRRGGMDPQQRHSRHHPPVGTVGRDPHERSNRRSLR